MDAYSSPMDKIKDLSDKEAIAYLSILSDQVYELDPSAGAALIDDAIPAAEKLLDERHFADENLVKLYYVLANLWSHRYRLKIRHNPNSSWEWDCEEHKNEIASLRKAVIQSSFRNTEPELQCCILTNLAGTLNVVGRPVDAIEYWKQALKIDAGFAMANGNLGVGLYHYGKHLYDRGHAALFFHFAYRHLEQALSCQLHDEERAHFQAMKDDIKAAFPNCDVDPPFDLNTSSLGRSKAERAYRSWCLKNCLFLNPLNDLGPYPIAAQDILHSPPLIVELSDETIPWQHKLINQLKQEFASARFLFYDGVHSQGVHFSDRNNLLYNTLDSPSYCLSTEKVKASLRMAYSLLDKIAWFIDEYFVSGVAQSNAATPGESHKRKRVYFWSVWYEKNAEKSEALKALLRNRKNWPLRGLYWLRNDFYQQENKLYLPPDTALMNEIRNQIEHNFFVVANSAFVGSSTLESTREASREYPITTDELNTTALRMLKTARASIIYLLLAISSEERRKKGDSKERLLVPCYPDVWEDKWKR
jgi:hypothetical protein